MFLAPSGGAPAQALEMGKGGAPLRELLWVNGHVTKVPALEIRGPLDSGLQKVSPFGAE